ncbi:hypothetical protein C8A00DRAFT_10935 [Chaetomidium leptoderma]|uniref:Uncharacterized protein n=1 Tax=Chaetomidium leptoderma TaxID=669021 RepID=A0AAN6VUT7_9PEZI|nr:hypothetical protein C8A00DRAFT_10935 [Chaetomidium leptoderma]
MAHGPVHPDDEFSQLWERHLTVLRDDFSATSVQALPSLPSVSQLESFDDGDLDKGGASQAKYANHPWDEKVDSVVDALDELTLQSPNTAETHSPGTPWFPDRDGYTETALSSPLNSSWPKTIGSCRNPGLPHLRVDDYSESPSHDPKGKGVETWPPAPTRHKDSTVPFLLQKQLLYTPHSPVDSSLTTATATATTTTTLHSPAPFPTQKGPPTQVHVLILTWAKHARRGPDGQLLTPSLDNNDTEMLRACLKRRGYGVQCRAIPTDYPTAAVETLLDRFLERSAADSLLVVYYHGYGCLEREGRMVFSSGPGRDASSFFWDDVRDPVMQVPGDVLLVFDCTALPGAPAEQCEMRVQAGMVTSASTKQLLGVCVPPSSGITEPGDYVTQSLCRTLDRMAEVPVLSVQNLCSLMREDLRETWLAPRVFVSQLGGGQLLDIYLPALAGPPRAARQSLSLW